MSRPIFVFGSGRSGTTLVQRMLNAADGVAIFGEHGGCLRGLAASYWELHHPVAERYLWHPPSHDAPGARVEHALAALKDCRHWSAWTQWMNHDDMQSSFREFIERMFKPREDVTVWGCKEIRYGFHDQVLEFLSALYPEARFVLVARHPFAVLESQLALEGFVHDMVDAAEMWRVQNLTYAAFAKQIGSRAIVIRYEDLMASPSDVLNLAADALSLKLGAASLRVVAEQEGRGARKEEERKKKLSRSARDAAWTIVNEAALQLGFRNASELT